jgi:DNA-directed RNA polymerase specialized sigma24 family protein
MSMSRATGAERVVGSPSRSPTRAAETACLDAFEEELDYIHRTLRRLGTPVWDVDDLALEVFLALRRSWRDYDPDRPRRPFLFGISYRVASVYQRTCRRRREVACDVVEVAHPGPGPDTSSISCMISAAETIAAAE